jgi:hypothetical protein
MPVTYALNTFGLCFASVAALFVWLFLEKRHQIMNIARASSLGKVFGASKTHRKNVQPQYEGVPTWWYTVAALAGIALGMFACEYYDVQLRWYGALFAFAISTIFFVPVSVKPPSSLFYGMKLIRFINSWHGYMRRRM